MSNFAFLQPEWATLHESARKAERLVYADSRASCFYARRALELAVSWLYKHDSGLRLPYQDHLSALIFEPTFRQTVGDAVFNKARVIKGGSWADRAWWLSPGARRFLEEDKASKTVGFRCAMTPTVQ